MFSSGSPNEAFYWWYWVKCCLHWVPSGHSLAWLSLTCLPALQCSDAALLQTHPRAAWLCTACHSSLTWFWESLLTHCIKPKVLHHSCQTLQCLQCQSQAHIANKLYHSARQKQCKTSLNTCFLEPCSCEYFVQFFPKGWASCVTN